MVSSSEQIPNTEHRPVESGEFQRSLDQINTRFDHLNQRVDDVNRRVDDFRSNTNARTRDPRNDLHAQIFGGDAWIRWGFGLIVALLITLMGLILSGVG